MPEPKDARRLVPDAENEPNFYRINEIYPLAGSSLRSTGRAADEISAAATSKVPAVLAKTTSSGLKGMGGGEAETLLRMPRSGSGSQKSNAGSIALPSLSSRLPTDSRLMASDSSRIAQFYGAGMNPLTSSGSAVQRVQQQTSLSSSLLGGVGGPNSLLFGSGNLSLLGASKAIPVASSSSSQRSLLTDTILALQAQQQQDLQQQLQLQELKRHLQQGKVDGGGASGAAQPQQESSSNPSSVSDWLRQSKRR